MSEVRVRLLGPEDAPVYQTLRLRSLQLDPQAFGTTWEEDEQLPLEVVAERLTHARSPWGRAVFGAFLGDGLVGFVGAMQETKRKTRHRAQIWGMYVAPDARRRGVGRNLLARLLEEIRAWHGVERVTLTVVERSTAARRLYSAVGFTAFGIEPDAFRHDGVADSAIHMTLGLHT